MELEKTTFKAGLQRKMKKAAMDRNYLARVLTESRLSQSCPGVRLDSEWKNMPDGAKGLARITVKGFK
ncbi:hypothetical protein OM235_07785 [Escherichia albertii]|nr:hypothetical protein [Escherichia albertii]MCZ8730972.1 hypothetical protein [Escherichia albertii]MCZ8883048.1 hypothetical protein [Escherichia albertii]